MSKINLRQGIGWFAAMLIVVSAIGAAPVTPAVARSDDDAYLVLRNIMRSWVGGYHIPRASAAMLTDGRIQKLYYGGMYATDPGSIASLSKAITAVCVARLVDDGRLSFSTPLGDVLAETFRRVGEPVDPRFKFVTIEQLLTHRSGFAREPMERVKAGDMMTTFRRVLATPLERDPGKRESYSNNGYLTLGVVIEAVTGTRYEEQCRRTVLAPLGAEGSIHPKLRHRASNGGWEMSAIDYAKFMQVWEPEAGVLGPRSRRWLDSREGETPYGLGIRIERLPRGIIYSHTGKSALGNAKSYAIKFEDGRTIVILYEGKVARGGSRSLHRQIREAFTLG